MTRRQEDQRREELAELKQLQASQTTDDNQSLRNSNTRDDAVVSLNEEKKRSEEELHQKQQSLNRLENLCAAAELSLKGLLDRLNASQESDSELWKKLREQQQQLQQQQQQQRKSVVNSLAAGSHPHRRASVLLPRRVSAVNLSHARRASAQNHKRRGSIEIPISADLQPQQEHQQQQGSVVYSIREGRISSIQEEGCINNILPHKKIALPAPEVKKNEFFSEVPNAVAELAHHFDLLLAVEAPSSSLTTPTISAQHRTASMPSGYKRFTISGPAWMANNKSASPQVDAVAASSFSVLEEEKPAGVTPRSERQQAQHEAQAAERYMRRLVGATVEPAPEIEDPFALSSSDEDDHPVFDRAALKHRSHKVTHPKQPRNAKKYASPKPNRGSPGGGLLSVAVLSPK
jgi:hypothetical protein